jgi:FtsP/CotA-like multicopper oxidase with cupredoxin domain
MTTPSNAARRDFLHLGWALGVGAILPVGLSACGGNPDITIPDETFVEPPVLASVNGLLDITLTLSYTSTTLNGKAVTLRSINKSIPAPTLRVNAGDTLRVKVVNQLPANPPSTEAVAHLRYPNSTNLHTHGLHVAPGLVAPGVYGDYVMDDPALGIAPGSTRHHEYRIGADHPAGAYWYHPHLHGSTAIQVGSGMAGALMIKGDIDRVPEIAAAKERVFMFQAPLSDAGGKLEAFADVASPASEPPFLINGVRRPLLVMRRGEVQNWHFINAAISKYLNLSLDGHALNAYSHDGNCRGAMQSIPPDPDKGLVLAPGNRDSVLVKAGAAGTYYLRTLSYDMGNPAVLPADVLAVVIVVDETMPMSLPAGRLPVPAALAPITDVELARSGGLKRNIVMRAVFNDNGDPVTSLPASAVLHPPPGELPDWQFQTGNTFMADTVFAMGSGSQAGSAAPASPAELIPFQSSRAQKQVVALGSVEEWTIFNMNYVQHPFHIHINPFQVVKINGAPVEPFWADTVGLPIGGTPQNPTSVTFRTRFLDFRGTFVMHCHILSHEDMGMMQTIEMV